MASPVVASPLEFISGAFASFGHKFLVVCEELGRARAARALYSALSAMSDEELSQHGLKRDEISRTVYSKVYDLR
jgi:hypothetical protein